MYHMDLYRLQPGEVAGAGVEDCLDSGAVCLVEWPENAPHLFDDTAVQVRIEPLSETERRIRLVPAAKCAGGPAGKPF